MVNLIDYSAYSCSLMPRNAADEVFILARRIQYITNTYAIDDEDTNERELTLLNLKDVASQNDFINEYNKIRMETEKYAQ